MSPLNPLAILGGVAAVGSGAVSKVAAGGNAFLQALSGGEPAAPQAPPLSAAEKEQRLQLKLQEFGDRIRERLKGAGIDITQPIELETSPTGGITVASSHPDFARIEAVLNDEPTAGAELADLLQQGSAGSLSLTDKGQQLTPSVDPSAFGLS